MPQRASVSAVPARAGRHLQPVHTEDLPPPKKKKSGIWKLYTALGMIFMLCLYLLGTLVVFPWWTGITNRWDYGKALIVATNQNVGHNDGSLFLSYYANKHAVVIEMTGKPIKGTVYSLPLDLDPARSHLITLSFIDINFDGKPDIVLVIDNLPSLYALVNTGSSYKWKT